MFKIVTRFTGFKFYYYTSCVWPGIFTTFTRHCSLV